MRCISLSLCLYIYISIYIDTQVHTCLHTVIRTLHYIRITLRSLTFLRYKFVHSYVATLLHAYAFIYIYTHNAYLHTCARMADIRTHTYICAYVHIHTQQSICKMNHWFRHVRICVRINFRYMYMYTHAK